MDGPLVAARGGSLRDLVGLHGVALGRVQLTEQIIEAIGLPTVAGTPSVTQPSLHAIAPQSQAVGDLASARHPVVDRGATG